MTSTDPFGEALAQLQAICQEFGMPVEQALREKADELRVRLFLKGSMPQKGFKQLRRNSLSGVEVAAWAA
jgi:hypothetical protein